MAPEGRGPLKADSGAAFLAGGLVATLGGLIGLGGAEFRLPLLVTLFGYAVRRAVAVNLWISLVTVVTAAVTRITVGRAPATVPGFAGVVLAMVAGGMIGAYSGSSWLVHVPEARLRRVVQVLLVGLGLVLVAEAAVGWESPGLRLGAVGNLALGTAAGAVIGVVSSLLGVAGGELIIPTLVFAFGVDVRSAGTCSLLISIPTILVGLWRQQAIHAVSRREARTLVAPMAAGSMLGAITGGLLVGYVSPAALKLLLGAVLIGSAVKVFGVEEESRERRST